jgi:hypothetical protein
MIIKLVTTINIVLRLIPLNDDTNYDARRNKKGKKMVNNKKHSFSSCLEVCARILRKKFGLSIKSIKKWLIKVSCSCKSTTVMFDVDCCCLFFEKKLSKLLVFYFN